MSCCYYLFTFTKVLTEAKDKNYRFFLLFFFISLYSIFFCNLHEQFFIFSIRYIVLVNTIL